MPTPGLTLPPPANETSTSATNVTTAVDIVTIKATKSGQLDPGLIGAIIGGVLCCVLLIVLVVLVVIVVAQRRKRNKGDEKDLPRASRVLDFLDDYESGPAASDLHVSQYQNLPAQTTMTSEPIVYGALESTPTQVVYESSVSS